MSRGIYEVCRCAHRHPEHSLFGACQGCLDCPDVEERPVDDENPADHPYRQCGCAKFDAVDEIAGADDREPASPV